MAAVDLYLSDPAANLSMEINPNHPASVMLGRTRVFGVFRLRNIPQIAGPVVQRVAVDVVDAVSRPPTICERKSDAASLNDAVEYPAYTIALVESS